MNGAVLLLPFLLIRFGVLSLLDKTALGRAAHFAPMMEKEKVAYYIYQLANVFLLLMLFFLKIHTEPTIFFGFGLVMYFLGLSLLLLTVIHFATPAESGLNQKGVYRYSRNPMYVAYFIYFLSCALLTQSILLLGVTLIFQVSAHWIILAEERWCQQEFGETYCQYKQKVRRYI